MNKLTATIVGAVMLSVAACGSSSDGGTSGGGGAGGGAGAGGAGGSGGAQPVACTASGDLDITGKWAALARLSITLQSLPGGLITICPADQVRHSEELVIYDVTPDPSDPKKVKMQPYLCSFTLPTTTALAGTCDPKADNIVTTDLALGPGLLDALTKLDVGNAGATLSALTPGATYSPDRLTFITGSKATDAAGLPSWNTADPIACAATNAGRSSACETGCLDCGNMSDNDGDGNPGDTICVCGRTKDDIAQKTACNNLCNGSSPDDPGVTLQGHAFVDFLTDPQFPGVAKSSCEIAGTVDARVQYNIVGGNIYLASAPISVDQAITSLPGFKVSPTDSTYEMIRVDGKYGSDDWGLDFADVKAACAKAIANQNSIP